MFRTLFPLCVIAIIVVACGEDEVPGIDAPPAAVDAPGGGDGATIDAAQTRPDAAMGVDCSGDTCTPSQECCVRGLGEMASCVNQGNCMGAVIECDGPEDCSGGDDCCLSSTGPTSGGSACTSGTCQREICHSPADCTSPTDMCCALGPLGVCAPNCTIM
jgi:hypothetical protein